MEMLVHLVVVELVQLVLVVLLLLPHPTNKDMLVEQEEEPQE
tara:strand:+ start:228 stop:353 length:126 start_codon:yes stop_codon:yes gene_type:complete